MCRIAATRIMGLRRANSGRSRCAVPASAATDLAYVAAGRFDGYWQRGLKPWDMAAGILLVREAGGFVQDIANSQANVLETGAVAAANGDLLPILVKELAKARKAPETAP